MSSRGKLVSLAGAILTGIGFIWGFVIGFYASQLPLLILVLGGGLTLIFIGSKMVAAEKPTEVEWRPSTEPMAPHSAASPAAPQTPVAPEAVAPSSPPVEHAADDAPSDSVDGLPDDAIDDAIDDGTVAVPRRRRRVWCEIELPDGTTAAVHDGAVIGRAPEALLEHPDDLLIVVDEPSVSKSHLRVRAVDGVVQVNDLGSSNGTIVIVDDIEHACEPGVWMLVPDGATLELGTVELRCRLTASREVAS